MFFETQVNINSDFSSVSLQEHCQECLVYTKYFCTNYDSSSASDNAMQIDNIDVVIFKPQNISLFILLARGCECWCQKFSVVYKIIAVAISSIDSNP